MKKYIQIILTSVAEELVHLLQVSLEGIIIIAILLVWLGIN